jgi:Ca2+-binding RTX toxin-like protein
MPISHLFSGNPINGTAEDDFIFGNAIVAGANNNINGGEGDDLIIGDIANWFTPFAAINNNSTATAFSIDAANVWTTEENALFGNAGTPHVTVLAEATANQLEFYSFTAAAVATVTIDIDFGFHDIGTSADFVVDLLNAMGTQISSNDDGSTSNGGLGSTSFNDAFLTFVVPSAGTYFIRVKPFGGGLFAGGETFLLNLSVTGHAATANAAQGNDTIVGGDGADTLLGAGGDDIINGGNGNDVIDGGSGTNFVNGDAGADRIISSGSGNYFGNDDADLIVAGITIGSQLLDGGNGADTLDTTIRGAGAFIYNLVTGASNIANETFVNFENLTSGATLDTITGSDGANVIRTNEGNDTVFGGGGNDTIEGGEGADILDGGAGNDQLDYTTSSAGVIAILSLNFVTGGHADGDQIANFENIGGSAHADVLVGNGGNNVLSGNAGNDSLDGGAGNDILSGGTGADLMVGGVGDDSLVVDNVGDVVSEGAGEGNDSLSLNTSNAYFLAPDAEIETISVFVSASIFTANDFSQTINGNQGSDTFNGLGGNDILIGSGGNDLLDGGTGIDTTNGGTGNDVHAVDNAGDIVIEAAGQGNDDRVFASVSYTLAAGVAVELLAVANQAAVFDQNLTGNEFKQTIIGNEGVNVLSGGGEVDTLFGLGGNDTLDGGSGDDSLRGGTGNDIYVVDSNGDHIIELAGEGADDRIFTTSSYFLKPGIEVELITTANQAGSEIIHLSGNEFRNLLFGNEAGNAMEGNEGNDELFGLGGNDVMDGGLGADILTGGAGSDLYIFGGGNIDEIRGFAGDTIALRQSVFTALSAGGLAPGAFVLGTAAQDADDRIIYDQATGNLFYDADGLGGVAAIQFAQMELGTVLSSGSFVVL